MSYQAVGDDLLSILRMFTSPRMGPFENTNTTAPFPPGSDEARAASDPSRYSGVGGDDALQGGARGDTLRPVPVARRVVQPQDPQTTGSVPGQPRTAPAVNSGASGALAQASPSVPDFVANSPAYQAWARQVAAQRQEALKEQALQNVFGGLFDVARSFGAEGGSSGASAAAAKALPSSALTLDQFKTFQDEATALENKRQALQRIPALAAQLGVSELTLLSMYKEDPKKFAETISKAMESEEFTDSEGTVWSRSPIGQSLPRRILDDPAKAEKAKADLAKVEVETNKEKATTNKIIQDTEQGKIDPKLLDDESLKVIAKTLQMPGGGTPEELATIKSLGREGLAKAFQQVTQAAAGRNDPRAWEGEEIKLRQAAKEKLRNSLGQIPTYENLQSILQDPAKVPRQGSAAADFINSYYRNINTIMGSPLDPGTMAAGQFNAQVAQLVRNAIRDYGANPSNSDRIAAMQEFGAEVPPEIARAQLGLVLKAKIWEVARHNEAIQDTIDNTDMAAGSKNALRAQQQRMPHVTDSTLRAMNVMPAEVAVLKSKIGTPQEAEARQLFTERHGRMIGEWALGELVR